MVYLLMMYGWYWDNRKADRESCQITALEGHIAGIPPPPKADVVHSELSQRKDPIFISALRMKAPSALQIKWCT